MRRIKPLEDFVALCDVLGLGADMRKYERTRTSTWRLPKARRPGAARRAWQLPKAVEPGVLAQPGVLVPGGCQKL